MLYPGRKDSKEKRFCKKISNGSLGDEEESGEISFQFGLAWWDMQEQESAGKGRRESSSLV